MRMLSQRATLISIEGIDGSGKTTHVKLLESYLRSRQYSVGSIHFPVFSTEIGGLLFKALHGTGRLPLHSLFTLFAANRLEQRPNIEAQSQFRDVVLFDRYSESEFAYGAGKGLPSDWLLSLESQMPSADLVVLLDLDARTAVGRLTRRSPLDVFEADEGFLERVRATYLSLAVSPPTPGQRWQVVNTSRSIDIVQSDIRAGVTGFLAAMRPAR